MTPSRTRHLPPVPVANDEIRTLREASRTLGQIVTTLEAGEAEKVVLISAGQMRAVVLSLAKYAHLIDATKEAA